MATLPKQSQILQHRDDISVMTSSDEGSEFEVTDSDIEPELLSDEEEDSSDDDIKLNWFQVTTPNELVRFILCSCFL